MKNKDLKQVILIMATLVIGVLLLGVMGGIAANTISFGLGAVICLVIVGVVILLMVAYDKCRH